MGNDTNWLVGRLYALSTAVAKRDWSEFTIRVHAEPKLDADFVLSTAAREIERLTAELAAMTERAAKAEENYQFMVDRAADQKLDGYRELGQRAADAENRADRLTAELAAMTAERDRLRESHRALHRRCQEAEAAVPSYRKLIATPPDGDGVRFVSGSLGRALLSSYVNKLDEALATALAERDETKEEIERLRQALDVISVWGIDWRRGPAENVNLIRHYALAVLRGESGEKEAP